MSITFIQIPLLQTASEFYAVLSGYAAVPAAAVLNMPTAMSGAFDESEADAAAALSVPPDEFRQMLVGEQRKLLAGVTVAPLKIFLPARFSVGRRAFLHDSAAAAGASIASATLTAGAEVALAAGGGLRANHGNAGPLDTKLASLRRSGNKGELAVRKAAKIRDMLLLAPTAYRQRALALLYSILTELDKKDNDWGTTWRKLLVLERIIYENGALCLYGNLLDEMPSDIRCAAVPTNRRDAIDLAPPESAKAVTAAERRGMKQEAMLTKMVAQLKSRADTDRTWEPASRAADEQLGKLLALRRGRFRSSGVRSMLGILKAIEEGLPIVETTEQLATFTKCFDSFGSFRGVERTRVIIMGRVRVRLHQEKRETMFRERRGAVIQRINRLIMCCPPGAVSDILRLRNRVDVISDRVEHRGSKVRAIKRVEVCVQTLEMRYKRLLRAEKG